MPDASQWDEVILPPDMGGYDQVILPSGSSPAPAQASPSPHAWDQVVLPSDGTSTIAKTTGYHPVPAGSPDERMEGNNVDKMGQPIFTLDQFRRGDAPFVTVAGDPAIPYGTPATSPQFPNVPFRINDTGAAFKGAGLSHFDIARDTKEGANADENNRPVHFDLSSSTPLPTAAPQETPTAAQPAMLGDEPQLTAQTIAPEIIRAPTAADMPAQALAATGRAVDALFQPGQTSSPLIPPDVAQAGLGVAAGGARDAAAAAEYLTGLPYKATETAAEQTLSKAASDFSVPESLASMMAFAVPGAAEAYAAGVVAKLPEQFGQIKDAAKQYGIVSPQFAQAATNAGLQDIAGILAVKGARVAQDRALQLARGQVGQQPPPTPSAANPPVSPLTPQGPLTANPPALASLELPQRPRAETAQPKAGTKAQIPLSEIFGGGESDASKITGPTGLSSGEVRGGVDAQAPLREQGQTAGAGQGQATSSAEPQTTGVANRVLAAEAKAGLIDETLHGEGMSWQEMVARGREQMNAGRDPYAVAREFKKTGHLSADDFSLLRAERERLAINSNQAADALKQNPTSKVLQDKLTAASAAESKFIKETIQPAKTATSNIFRGMQGEAPIDTTTFEGLRRAVLDMKGHEPTAAQAVKLKVIADQVKGAISEEATAARRVGESIERNLPRGRTPTLAEAQSVIADMVLELTPC